MSHSAYRSRAPALHLAALLISGCGSPIEGSNSGPDAATEPFDTRDGGTSNVTGDAGSNSGPGPCPSIVRPAIDGCDGVLLTAEDAVLDQSGGIADAPGPVASPAVRIGDDQWMTIKDAGCHQLGKDGADFSVSMWLKASAGTSQIIGTTSQYSRKQGFILHTNKLGDGTLELQLASFADGVNATVKSAPFAPDTWTHVVLRYDANGSVATASLDVNLQPRTGPAAPDVYNERLRVGDEGYGNIAPFEVSELRSYQRLLTDGEVRALFVEKAEVVGVATAELGEALDRIQGHVDGGSPLSASDLAAAAQAFSRSSVLLGTDAELMDKAFQLVASYETTHGALFMTDATKGGIVRAETEGDGLELARVMLTVQQAILDRVFVAENADSCSPLLEGKRFVTADYFPGMAPPPADPKRSYDVTVDATVRADWGRPVAFSQDPVRRPTGLYLSPGSIGRVSVPEAMVNAGFSILVGAHTADLSNKWIHKRMDRVSTSFPITQRETRIANPLGGGVYIVVPYLADLGKVEVSVTNVIEAPFFSGKSSDKTTAEQWRARRTAPAPWADFETDKFMMQVPSSWIYAVDDPTDVMRDWDTAMDGVSELLGYPPENRNRTVLYQQVDVMIRHGAYGIGYPQVNITYNPHTEESGDKDHWLLRDPTGWHVDYHELGHAQLFSKFPGETEAAVNFPHVYVRNVKFGVDFDQAFRESLGTSAQYRGYTPDDAAVHWMVTDNFRAGRPMDLTNSTKNEFRYQARGYAKYADIYRLFGWQALRDFFRQEHVDYMKGTPSDGLDAVDSRILRLSVAAGADLTPLIHFWGVHPVKPDALKQKLAERGVKPSEAVRAHIARYKTVAPKNNADFNAHYERIYPGRPSGDNPDYGDGWYNAWRDRFNESHAADIQTQVDRILQLYYP
jgi:hypothetical protein